MPGETEGHQADTHTLPVDVKAILADSELDELRPGALADFIDELAAFWHGKYRQDLVVTVAPRTAR